MSNLFYPNDSDSQGAETSTWDEVRRIADEIELKIHLAGMNLRDRWRAIEPRIEELEQRIASSGERAGKVIKKELSALRTLVQKLRDDISTANGS